jgi:2-amino-4-hydroxy-6-hydroxymethyldihydropteridine diphosphokinase
MKEAIFLGLGSNLGDREWHLRAALEALRQGGCAICSCSPIFETPPWGNEAQPSFLNAVVEVVFEGSPMALLGLAMQVEESLARVRTVHWGPRSIDIDILAFGNQQLATQRLTVPHPMLAQRAFVLVPWARIAPQFAVPGHDSTVIGLLLRLPAAERDQIVELGTLWPATNASR